MYLLQKHLFYFTLLMLACVASFASSTGPNDRFVLPTTSYALHQPEIQNNTVFFLALAEGWHFGADIGYTKFGSSSSKNHGSMSTFRATIRKSLLRIMSVDLALEVSVQNGAHMQPAIDDDDLLLVGATSPHVEMKAFIDSLLSAKLPMPYLPKLYMSSKAGLAYRRIIFMNDSSIDTSHFDPELQLGIIYQINSRADISLHYQWVHGAGFHYDLDLDAPSINVSGHPPHHGIHLGMNILL